MEKRNKWQKAVAALLTATLAVTAAPTSGLSLTSVISAESKLSAPTNIKLAVSGSTLTISWSAVKGASAYRVYLYNSSKKGFTALKDVTATECKVSGVKSGSKYSFKIAALVKSGSSYSVQTLSETKSVTIGSSGNSSGAGGNDKVYSSSKVTKVKNKAYTYNGKKGTYTGEWKGDRPEGKGRLTISKKEYYDGEWFYGATCGDVEYRTVYSDGSWEYFKGLCVCELPIGKGEYKYHSKKEKYDFVASGDFSKDGKVKAYFIDEDGHLTNLGTYRNGKFVSSIDDPKAKSINFTYGDKEAGWKGKYIGETNKKGLPNGYGYFESYPITADYVQDKTQKIVILGEWKNGEICGKYTYYWSNDRFRSKLIAECDKNGDDIGKYTLYEYMKDGYSVYTKNCNTYQRNLKTGKDGIDRGSYEEKKFYYNDGTYCYYRRRFCINYNTYLTFYEGEYGNYDKNGKLTDYGVPEGSGWRSAKSYEISDMEKLIATGLIIGGGYLLVKAILSTPVETSVPTTQQTQFDYDGYQRKKNYDYYKSNATYYANSGDYEKAKFCINKANYYAN